MPSRSPSTQRTTRRSRSGRTPTPFPSQFVYEGLDGAAVTAPLGSVTAYQLAAVALADGRIDAIVDTGSALVHTTLLPGLTVRARRTSLKGGGKSVVTNAVGVAKLGAFKRGARITVAAPGYAPASFRKADQTARHERRPARRVRVTTTNATEHAVILALNRRLGFAPTSVGTTASLSLAHA